MIYRPQFVYPTPRGYRDEQFHYTFDQSNTPALNTGNLAAGLFVFNIPLNLQADAPFFLRGWSISGANVSDPQISGRLREPGGVYLSDDFIPFDLYARPLQAAIVGNLNVVWEPGIECPAGGTFLLDLKNQTNGAVNLNLVRISLEGVKRRLLERAA